MGYDLHITRRKDWSRGTVTIAASEWLAFVAESPEFQLRPSAGAYFAVWTAAPDSTERWLDWSDGQIYTKNPDPVLAHKMLLIARRFDAMVQGDDGEVYHSLSRGDHTREPLLDGIRRRLRRATRVFAARISRDRSVVVNVSSPFAVGDRVRDSWGHEHIVTHVDMAAEHGHGLITTRRADGRELRHSAMAHGLTRISPD